MRRKLVCSLPTRRESFTLFMLNVTRRRGRQGAGSQGTKGDKRDEHLENNAIVKCRKREQKLRDGIPLCTSFTRPFLHHSTPYLYSLAATSGCIGKEDQPRVDVIAAGLPRAVRHLDG